jgi:hypothetical protein
MTLLMAAMLVACAGPTEPAVYEPSRSPRPLVRAGDFMLEISSPRESWAAGEPIAVTATLTYLGDATTTIYGPEPHPLSFGVREIGGTREMAAFLTYEGGVVRIGPEPLVVEYRKSGGWSPGDDPNEAFYERFFADPELRLPAGRWEIYVWARFATEEGGPYTVDTTARLWLTIE